MKITISATLRTFFGRRDEVEIPGNTIADILGGLTQDYPESKKGLYDESGRLGNFIRIFVNGEDRTDSAFHNELIPEDAEVLLLPLVAGGAPGGGEKSIIPDERRKAVTLDDREIERYEKHLLLREVGVKGQKRIKAAKVVVAGAGALGSPVIQYLAAAGIGTIKVVDFDMVAPSNLSSQVIHAAKDLKRPKDRCTHVSRG